MRATHPRVLLRLLLAFAIVVGVAGARVRVVAAPSEAHASPRPAVLPTAGSGGHGWFADEGQRGLTFPSVYHLPPGLEPGSVRPGPRVAETPVALASWGERVLLVLREERADLPASRDRAAGADAAASAEERPERVRLIRRVLTVTARPGPATGMWEYIPRGRDPIAMPSLPGRGTLVGVAMTGGGAYALLSGLDDGDQLLTLPDGARGWTPMALPDGWISGRQAFLVGADDRVVLLQRGETGSFAWRSAATGGEGASWEREAVDLRESDRAVVFAGGSLVAASIEDEGRVSLHLLRMGERHHLATVEHGFDRLGVFGQGDAVVVVWRGGVEPTRLRTVAVSAATGALLYDGPARTSAVVSGREIQSLALLAGALMLTILIFVLRPEDAVNAAIVVPEGYALASPMRRVLAVLIDLALPLALCAAAMGVSAGELLAAAALSESATTGASLALGLGALIAGAHSALSEWLTGRTVGKLVTRCRTCTIKGERPRLWQTGLRSLVKLLFPPFALFLFLDPRRRHPGDLVSGTVVVQRVGRASGEGEASARGGEG